MLKRVLGFFRNSVQRRTTEPVVLGSAELESSGLGSSMIESVDGVIRESGLSVEYVLPMRESALGEVSDLQVLYWVELCDDPNLLRRVARAADSRANKLSGPAIVFERSAP